MDDLLRARFTAPYEFDVVFTRGVLDPANPALRQHLAGRTPDAPPRALFVLDSGLVDRRPNLAREIDRYADAQGVDLTDAPVVIPGGEACKNDRRWLDLVHDAIGSRGVCRRSYVVAIGGGAALDVAGFAAATAHRGVRHVRIPTTTLSQADSGVGVKNGVNASGMKNFLGSFAPPDAVLIDGGFLATLDDREWRAGIAEAVKVALLKDPDFFAWIETAAPALARRDHRSMGLMIRRSAALHLTHITAGSDPFERGPSRPLDFGHWAAHRLETLSGYEIGHGAAVAIGVALDLQYSRFAGLLEGQIAARAIVTLEAVGFDVFAPLLVGADGRVSADLLQGLDEFREHLGGELTIMLLAALGRGVEVHTMDRDLLDRAVTALRARSIVREGVG